MLAFSTGILGAFHCLGMCGGLTGGFFAGYGWQQSVKPYLIYHGSRISVYTILGIIGAMLGQVIVQTGILAKAQGLLMMLAGVIIVVIGLIMLRHQIRKQNLQNCTSSCAAHPVSFLNKRTTTGKLSPWIGGLFNGLVPCSLVFSVAIKAAATANPMNAGLIMLSFGAGTLPTMMAVSAFGSGVSCKLKGQLGYLTAFAVIASGVWTLLEGWSFYEVFRTLANW